MASRVGAVTRWLGWTGLFVLVCYGGVLLVTTQRPFGQAVNPLLLLPVLAIVAFLIGLRFSSRWWVFGPPVATYLTYLVFLGAPLFSTPHFMFEFWYALALTTLPAVLFALAARAGVTRGCRRSGQCGTPASRLYPSHLADPASAGQGDRP